MQRVQQRWSRVQIYTNYEGDDVDLEGDDDLDGDVAVDDKDGTSPHAKGVPIEITVSNSPPRQPQRSMISPLCRRRGLLPPPPSQKIT
jgi:hypothetical protein